MARIGPEMIMCSLGGAHIGHDSDDECDHHLAEREQREREEASDG